MERADAWELRPGENGPETAAPDATTARHFVDELVKHAGHGNEAAGAKMKTLAMHLLNRPESRMSNRPESRMSNGSSVPTERADSRASVCTSPPGSPCRRFTSREDLESTAEPDVPCRFRTREGESSELRLRCMLSEREKYILDPCAWKLGAVQVMAHRHGMVKFINELRRDFGLNSRVTWKAVTYMDRYVCLTSSGESSGVMLERAELCAVVCLLLACKFQERFFPSIPKLLEAISTPYSKEELKAAEVCAPAACCPTTEPHLAPRLLPAHLAYPPYSLSRAPRRSWTC